MRKTAAGRMNGTMAVSLFAIALPALAMIALACGGGDAPALIVYEASDGKATNVFTIDPATAEVRQLTFGSGFDGNPAWSPDRSQIVFSSRRDGQTKNDLYLMDRDGGNATRLTDTPGAAEFSPKFSPDGATLAYVIAEDDAWSVWTSRADGTRAERVAGGYFFVEFPAWTPNGRALFYSAIEDRGASVVPREYSPQASGGTGAMNADIYSVDLNTRAVRTELSTPGRDICPHVSRDGRTLLYASTRAEGGETLRIFAHDIASGNTSGAGDTALTDQAARSDYPAPSPDGSQIAFITDRDGATELYIMNADGTDQRRLTTSPDLQENVPHW